MGILDSIFGKKREDTGIEEYLDISLEEGDVVSPPPKYYIRRVDLRNEGDADLALKEINANNVIILNVKPLSNQPNRLKNIIAKLKVNITKIDGDIALLTHDYVLLAPSRVKIVKSKKKAEEGGGSPSQGGESALA
ncbi:MAG: cell division protein SepF [Candidatus Anstonellales archaeon]